MAEEKQLPNGVLKRLTFEAKRSSIEPILDQQICRIDLRKRHLEILMSYNFTAVVVDFDSKKVTEEKDDIVRMNDVIPKEQLAIQRALYSQDGEEIPEGQSAILHHAVIIRYQGCSFWIYTTQKDADFLFKEIRAWMLEY